MKEHISLTGKRFYWLVLSILLVGVCHAGEMNTQLAEQVKPLITDWLNYYQVIIQDFKCEQDTCPQEKSIYSPGKYQINKLDKNSIYNKIYRKKITYIIPNYLVTPQIKGITLIFGSH